MVQNTDTGGGFYAEGDISAGQNFTGRDSIVNNFHEEPSDRELLRDIHDLLLGNARKGREKGLVHIVSEMRQDIENLYHFTWGLIVALVAVVILVAYLLITVTAQTPTAAMQVPHQTPVYTEGQVYDKYVSPGDQQ